MKYKASFEQLELDRRLRNWSYWATKFQDGAIGYPSKATIADFGLPGSLIRKSKPPFPLNCSEADEMNGWINIMGEAHREYKAIVYAFYLRKNGIRIAELAKIFNISDRMFKQRLREARLWLTGRLSSDLQKIDQK